MINCDYESPKFASNVAVISAVQHKGPYSMHWDLPTNLTQSGIREILNLALAKPGTIRLETGEPNFPPAPHILDAYVEASHQGHNRYTATEGIPSLRAALSEKIRRVNGVVRSPEEILVTPGGLPALFLSFLGTAGRGGAVMVPDPGWPDYLGGMISLGIEPVAYPLQSGSYEPQLDDLERCITANTRAIVLNFPGNPTGRVLTTPQVENLVAFAKRHDLWIISDEVYDQIVFEREPLSPARLAPERTLSVYSFSKTYAMTGWRLGYLAGPVAAVQSLTRVAMGTWSSVSEPLQYAGLGALTGPQQSVSEMVQQYRVRRDRAMAQLESYKIAVNSPDGAFYLLADISSSGLLSRTFALRLVEEKGVAVAPGSAFGRHSEGLVRISLASSQDDLNIGLERLNSFLHQVKQESTPG